MQSLPAPPSHEALGGDWGGIQPWALGFGCRGEVLSQGTGAGSSLTSTRTWGRGASTPGFAGEGEEVGTSPGGAGAPGCLGSLPSSGRDMVASGYSGAGLASLLMLLPQLYPSVGQEGSQALVPPCTGGHPPKHQLHAAPSLLASLLQSPPARAAQPPAPSAHIQALKDPLNPPSHTHQAGPQQPHAPPCKHHLP